MSSCFINIKLAIASAMPSVGETNKNYSNVSTAVELNIVHIQYVIALVHFV